MSSPRTWKIIGLGLLGAYAFLSSFLINHFAELHVTIPRLPFPIFVGELLFGICLVLTVLVWRAGALPPFPAWIRWALGALGLFVLLKAAVGYWRWGPLALRNAAMFYYAFFALFGSALYEPSVFANRKVRIALAISLGILLLPSMAMAYFWFPILLFLSLFVCRLLRGTWRVVTLTGLLFLLCRFLFTIDVKGVFTASLCTFALLGVAGGYLLIHQWGRRMFFVPLSVLTIIPVCFFFPSGENIASALNWKGFADSFVKTSTQLQLYEGKVSLPTSVPVRLYEPESPASRMSVSARRWRPYIQASHQLGSPWLTSSNALIRLSKKTERRITTLLTKPVVSPPPSPPTISPMPKTAPPTVPQLASATSARPVRTPRTVRKVAPPKAKVSPPAPVVHTPPPPQLVSPPPPLPTVSPIPETTPPPPPQLGTVHSGVWRMFVILDMLSEWVHRGVLFGIDFGKPFRSKKIEILVQLQEVSATGWWVGWLEPHNSFVHILYRSGVVGIAFIVFLLSSAIGLVRKGISASHLPTLVLGSLLIYWLVLANFEVILELPYFAIPFWTLLGLSYAYTTSRTPRC